MFSDKKYTEIKEFLKKNNENCQIVAISKNHPKESVIEAINTGVSIFGENRVMEAKNKFEDLKEKYPHLELHLTGPLQSNKVKTAVKIFDVFHTLDREKIAKELSKYNEEIKGKKIFVQVNIGLEDTKSGIQPNQLTDFLNYCNNDLKIDISGLMCIPPIDGNPKVHFESLKNLAIQNNIKDLSIGMSGDYLEALEFGPRYIRLGTILFGTRN